MYILLFLSPMNWEILNAESLVKVGYTFGDCVDDVCNFITDNELDILGVKGNTLAANWSPMKSPSLILMGPKRN